MPIARRWPGLVSRCLAAILGGYLLASLVAVGCALWLGPPRAEAVLTGMMLSFVVHACAVLWVFAARSAARAWAGLALPGVLLGVAVLLGGGLA